MEFRLAQHYETSPIRRLWEQSFDDTPEYIDYFFTTFYQPQNTVVASNEQGKIVFAAHLTQHQLLVQNQSLPISYIVGVVTAPEERGKGIMRQAMAYIFNNIAARQQVFSMMMAIDSRLYDRYGYRFISDMSFYEIDTQLLKRPPNLLRMRPASLSDCQALSNLYHETHQNQHMVIERHPAHFQRLLQEYKTDHATMFVVENANAQLSGYLVYSSNHQTLNISEWAYQTDQALDSLLNFCYHHNMQLPKTTLITTPDDPIKHLLHYWKKVPIVQNIVKPFMLGRIHDVENLFLHIGFPVGQPFDPLDIKIIDPNIPKNDRVFCFAERDSVLTVKPTASKPQLTMSIHTLTQLVPGYMDGSQANQLNLIHKEQDYPADQFIKLFPLHTNFLNEYN